jgi:mannose-6-phosphate isomerase-like protein (cupin superfamily)
MKKPGHTIEAHQTVGIEDGAPFGFGAIGGRFKVGGDATDGRFVVGQMPEIPPKTLAAPLHRHNREDEYTYVVAGTLGVMAGDDVVTAGPGMWLIKPRGEWHTFWNAGDTPCHVIEIVSPAGFERYFSDVADVGGDPARLPEINRQYGIDMDFASVPRLCERFGLTFPEPGP